MDAKEIAQQVLSQLTGGLKVCPDIETGVVEGFVRDAFRECRPWYDEPDKWETVNVVRVGTDQNHDAASSMSGYIDLSDPKYGDIKLIRGIIPTALRREYIGDYVRDLLLLPGTPIGTDSETIMEIAQWKMTWPMVRNVIGKDLTYHWIKAERKCFVDDFDQYGGANNVTICYVPEPRDVTEVTVDVALTWIIEMTKALTGQAIANIRGKFRGGAVRFETDASDHLSTSQQRMSELREQLKTLHFTLCLR